MSYKNLDIWKLARELVRDIHVMTLNDLPKFEMFEVGSQIRRSAKSIKANIVEGYGRRMYKHDYIRFLTYAHSSCDETIDHIDTLFITGSLSNKEKAEEILSRLNILGSKLNRFIQSVTASHMSLKESAGQYEVPGE